MATLLIVVQTEASPETLTIERPCDACDMHTIAAALAEIINDYPDHQLVLKECTP